MHDRRLDNSPVQIFISRHRIPALTWIAVTRRHHYSLTRAGLSPQRLYQQLSAQGFRRSGSHLYRPRCGHCNACIAVRLPVSSFHRDAPSVAPARKTRICVLELRMPALRRRHYKSMNATSACAIQTVICTRPVKISSNRFSLRLGRNTVRLPLSRTNSLISVAVTDQLDDGLSAVYTFFEPSESARSLGVFSILQQIEQCRSPRLVAPLSWAIGSKSREDGIQD